MKLTFCGASHEVTGSCYHLDADQSQILVDCGLFQGSEFSDEKNWQDWPFKPASVEAVLITHAHLDHVGRLPKLVKDGFRGKILATPATAELARLVIEDAFRIMFYEHEKFQRPLLYEDADVRQAVSLFEPVDYNKKITVAPGIEATWHDAGHIFGAAFIVVEAEGKKVAFSGDIGNINVPILRETEALPAVDALLVESTYGDRVHEGADKRLAMLEAVLKEAAEKGGTIMVPAFSIERTQEFLYSLHQMQEHGDGLPKIPIYLDSPLAIDAIKVYKKYPQYYDKEAAAEIMAGDDFLTFPGLHVTYTREDSKTINNARGPKMVIAGAGMMNGGRILHHAMRYLPDPNSTLLIVGYQAYGTLGRRLYEGAKWAKIHGEDIPVRCAIKAIGALSAHGDQKKMIEWVGSSGHAPKQIFCIHGEPHAATELAHRIRDTYGVMPEVPEYCETVEL